MLKGQAKATIDHHKDGNPNGFVVDAPMAAMMKQIQLSTLETSMAAGRVARNLNHRVGIIALMDLAANILHGDNFFNFKLTAQSVGYVPAY